MSAIRAASRSSMSMTVRGENPVASRIPISRERRSTPRRKSRATSIAADTSGNKEPEPEAWDACMTIVDPDAVTGDIDGDSKVNIKDLLLMQRILIGDTDGITPTMESKANIYTDDGEGTVNISDLLKLETILLTPP